MRPSQGSSQRIIGDLRSVKWSTRREERYRILSSHRAGLPTEPTPAREGEENDDSQTENRDNLALGEVQVFDILHEDGDVKVPGKVKLEDFIHQFMSKEKFYKITNKCSLGTPHSY